MFVIFGWPNLKSGSQSLSMPCSRCRRVTVHNAHTLRQWFSLFFHSDLPPRWKTAARDMLCLRAGRVRRNLRAVTASRPPERHAAALAAPETSRPTKRCPACAEEILLDAALCRFCGRQFSARKPRCQSRPSMPNSRPCCGPIGRRDWLLSDKGTSQNSEAATTAGWWPASS